MSSTTATVARCTSCRQARDPGELLLVFVRGLPSYSVCRPGVYNRADQHVGPTPCFRVTGPAELEPIEILADYLARQEVSA